MKDKFGRELHEIICSSCGEEATIPFKPTEGKKYYCRFCYKKMKNLNG